MNIFTESSGFTLMEIVVVLVIVGILAGGVVPMFSESISSLQRERAVRELVAMIRFASELAIIQGVETRLYVFPDRSLCAVQVWDSRANMSQTESSKDNFEKTEFRLPGSLRFTNTEALSDDRGESFYIRFYPNGACDFGATTLRDDLGATIRIVLNGSVSNLKVEST